MEDHPNALLHDIALGGNGVSISLYLSDHKFMNTAHGRNPYSLDLILAMNTATLQTSRVK
jgi:hypothetical protein